MVAKDEQAERITESLQDWYENPEDYSMQDFEDIFEDLDPFEFL